MFFSSVDGVWNVTVFCFSVFIDCVLFAVNGNTGSRADVQLEKSSHSSSLSTSSLSASESVEASPQSSDTHKLTTESSSPVSVATIELPVVAVTTSMSSFDVAESFRFETSSQTQPDVDDNDLFFDKKKDAQDIVSALQGSFDFLQDSEIDEDSE